MTKHECRDCGHIWKADEPAPAPHDWRNLPAEFWASRPVLGLIRQAAHFRVRSADAVLLCVLARVALLTSPTIALPAIAGGRASLNFLGGIVSSSGGGKTTADVVAGELLPVEQRKDIVVHSLGSGEGAIEGYFEMVDEEIDGKKRKVKKQTKVGAMYMLDEGQALAEMGGRSGATLLPTLRSAWSGSMLGQANATVETHRKIPAHKYRFVLLAGFQPEYASGLIADAAGGTPQRFVFAHGVDSTIPNEPIEWPGEIDWRPPGSYAGGIDIDFEPSIAAEIRSRALMRQQGKWEPDPLDSHADLARMKMAALLAILDGRLYVEPEDWELAGMIMRSSAAVRTWVIELARSAAVQTEQAFAAKLANRAAVVEDTAEQRALESGARSMARKVHRSEVPLSKRELLAAAASKHKQLASADEMIALAVDRGWLTTVADGWKSGDSRPT